MSDLITQVLKANCTKENELKSLHKYLENNFEPKLVGKPQHYLTQLIRDLDPEKHTLGMIYVMFVKSHMDKVDIQAYVTLTETLIRKLHRPQAVVAPFKFCQVIQKYCEILRDRSMYSRGLLMIEACLKKFAADNMVTPVHSQFLCMCLKSKNYQKGYKMLQKKIYDINPPKTGMTPRELMCYFYYGGMIYIGLKKYEEAIDIFDQGLCVPAFAFDAIQIEIFKKFVLVNLLHKGKYLGVSKNASPVIHRHMKIYCDEYIDFANAYAKGDFKKLQEEYKKGAKTFKDDRNGGLIKQCLDSFHKRSILKLTQTFVSISLEDIGKQVGIDSTRLVEKYLLEMIEKGLIHACISQKNGTVQFTEESQPSDQEKTAELLGKLGKTISLNKKIETMNLRMGRSLDYVARLHGVRDQDALSEMQGRRGFGGVGSMMKGVGKLLAFH